MCDEILHTYMINNRKKNCISLPLRKKTLLNDSSIIFHIIVSFKEANSFYSLFNKEKKKYANKKLKYFFII